MIHTKTPEVSMQHPSLDSNSIDLRAYPLHKNEISFHKDDVIGKSEMPRMHGFQGRQLSILLSSMGKK